MPQALRYPRKPAGPPSSLRHAPAFVIAAALNLAALWGLSRWLGPAPTPANEPIPTVDAVFGTPAPDTPTQSPGGSGGAGPATPNAPAAALPAPPPLSASGLAADLPVSRNTLHGGSHTATTGGSAWGGNGAGAGFGSLFAQVRLDRPPLRESGPDPIYPPSLKRAGVTGRASILVVIAPDGRVTDARLESATDPKFGEAALEAVRHWRYLPALRNGQPVSVRHSQAINFTLD